MTAFVAKRFIQLMLAIVLVQHPSVFAQQFSEFTIIESVAHNPDYFTQGLEISDGLMFESSGRYGKSTIRKYRPGTDKTLLDTPIADKYFAEGLTLFNDQLFLLTWRENTLLVLNPDNLAVLREHSYDGEGWGLASNSSQLIMSNGSDTITFRHPETFKIEKQIQVHFNQHPVNRLNELEFAQGYLWANIWHAPLIIKINPATGAVVAAYDFSALVAQHSNGNDERVLNGIAYDAQRDAFWITGKLWPRSYLVSLQPTR